jgi:hypothetical protein
VCSKREVLSHLIVFSEGFPKRSFTLRTGIQFDVGYRRLEGKRIQECISRHDGVFRNKIDANLFLMGKPFFMGKARRAAFDFLNQRAIVIMMSVSHR